MKKFLTTFLFVCSCALVGAAVGCDDSKGNGSDSTVVLGEERSVSFETGVGYDFLSNVEEGVLRENAQLKFTLDLGAFYTDTAATVYVNDKIIPANTKGEYIFTVGSDDIVVRAEGIREDVSNMSGSGALNDAFVVTRPIDLIYIAEQVNSGNPAYIQGAYVLANDIDCKGEELKIIGDRSTEQSVFCGSFACENGEEGMVKHTISNFTINSDSTEYVGLFGTVLSDMSVQSSALFYGISLENFTINATNAISVGGLIGYGVGTTLFLCDAIDGEITTSVKQNYYGYAGGLIGYQQGYYDVAYDAYYPAEIAYAEVSTDVRFISGLSVYGGGITGYMATNYPYGATASIHNSYSSGEVSGALRSGGIVGGMGRYSVVSNCYATGLITANSPYKLNDPTVTEDEAYAYAGGLVGYAENDSVAHDSFFNGETESYAVAGTSYASSGAAVAGGDKAGFASADGQKYLALNCLEKVDLATVDFTKALGWQKYDWVFAAGELPTINYDSPEGTVTLTLTVEYVAPLATGDKAVSVRGKKSGSLKYFDTSIQSLSSYHPIGSYMGTEALPLSQKADNGYLSYGYFFDKECTQKVPLSYYPTKEFTMYVGFADPKPVNGTYSFIVENNAEPLTISFDASGKATYTDGATEHTVNYTFDGTNVYLEMARLARYYQGDVVVDENNTSVYPDANFELNRYGYYNFMGTLTETGVSFYDGIYFTESDPLVAMKNALHGEFYTSSATETVYYTLYGDKALVETLTSNGRYSSAEYDTVVVKGNIVTLSDSNEIYDTVTLNTDTASTYDAYKGSWTKSATVNKTYVFDGIDSWEYKYVGYDRNGSDSPDENVIDKANGKYEIKDGNLVFTHGNVQYVASFNSDGYLEIVGGGNTQLYYANESFEGTWRGSNYTLVLSGIRNDGTGSAILRYDGTDYDDEYVYEVSETSGVLALYALADGKKNAFYGYLTYNRQRNVMTFVQPDATGEAESGYAADTLYVYDDYMGDWVCNLTSLTNVDFHFNGMGLYPYVNGKAGELTITENGKDTVVPYSLNSALEGKFSYKGITYDIAYDDALNQIVVTQGANTTLERKDELANIDFVDLDGVRYVFDGKSTLDCGGTLTIDKVAYNYYPSENGYAIVKNSATVGSLVKGSNHYLLTIDNVSTELYIANEFMGDWAISNQYAIFHIEPTDTNGVIHATYKGSPVELTYIAADMLTFKYREGNMPITYYVYVEEDTTYGQEALVLSEYTSLAAGEYIICSKINDLYGTWEWNRDNGKTTLRIDGVTSGYANGNAVLTLQLNYSFVATDYYYNVREGGIIMWSTEALAGSTLYFSLTVVPESETATAAQEKDAFVLRNEEGEVIRVLRKVEVDGLFLTNATDEAGVQYSFDGKGNILSNGEVKYTYKIKSYNANNTATLEVTAIYGSVYTATLDYKDSKNILFILGEEIEASPEV